MRIPHSFVYALLGSSLTCGIAAVETDSKQQNQTLPTIKLPYGTWQATSYDKINDIYTFKNIRYGAPPIGKLRFAKPAPPAVNETLQTGKYGPGCLAVLSGALLNMGGSFNGGNTSSGSGAPSGLGALDPTSLMNGAGGASEDCLFLDVYVPGKAFRGETKTKLPVVNWIYGGAYLIGTKDNDGAAIVKASGGNVIYVGGNYRLGLLGWLAGSTVEREGNPNAGLWDQRAVFEWINKYIGLFGGDPKELSVWGESAGAGSITHHLTAFGGEETALFKRAVIESPAYDFHVERTGHLEKQFQGLANYAGCAGKGLECLRSASISTIMSAQKKLLDEVPSSKPGVGPAVDGTFLRQPTPLEFKAGHVVKGVESIIVSHTLDEGKMFVPSDTSDAAFEKVLRYFWGSSNSSIDAIKKQYLVSKFPSEKERFRAFLNWSTFLCATRYIPDAYENKTYNMVYSQGAAVHGSDIGTTFYDATGVMGMATKLFNPKYADLAPKYQAYLISHARSGDPNTFKAGGTVEWPKVSLGGTFGNVLNVTDNGFALISDPANKEEDCAFWTKIMEQFKN